MEDYKQKYEDALKKAKIYHRSDSLVYTKETMEDLFPELKESEGERIRKAIKLLIEMKEGDSIGLEPVYGASYKEMIAWLEKQGEQNPTDKVEPKFKVGDWVTNGINFTFQVRSIEDNMYLRSDEYFIDIETADKTFRLWTIQDAKDGDVLVGSYDNCKKPWIGIFKCISKDKPTTQFDSYCFLTSSNHIFTTPLSSDFYNRCKGHTSRYVLPATKEQRDTLMKAMADAGYTFDFEKKELRKIEQNPVDLNSVSIRKLVDTYRNTDEYDEDGNHKGKPVNCMVRAYEQGIRDILKTIKQKDVNRAWSEEDESILQNILVCLKNGWRKLPTDILKYESWLKSLKERYTWKPSDEQIKGIKCAIKTLQHQLNVGDKRLDSLYNDLKKLKEE